MLKNIIYFKNKTLSYDTLEYINLYEKKEKEVEKKKYHEKKKF